jgi:hypothetical protein
VHPHELRGARVRVRHRRRRLRQHPPVRQVHLHRDLRRPPGLAWPLCRNGVRAGELPPARRPVWPRGGRVRRDPRLRELPRAAEVRRLWHAGHLRGRPGQVRPARGVQRWRWPLRPPDVRAAGHELRRHQRRLRNADGLRPLPGRNDLRSRRRAQRLRCPSARMGLPAGRLPDSGVRHQRGWLRRPPRVRVVPFREDLRRGDPRRLRVHHDVQPAHVQDARLRLRDDQRRLRRHARLRELRRAADLRGLPAESLRIAWRGEAPGPLSVGPPPCMIATCACLDVG